MNKSKRNTRQKHKPFWVAVLLVWFEWNWVIRLMNICHHSSSQDPKRQEKPNPYGNHGCGKFHTLVVQRPFLRYGGIYLQIFWIFCMFGKIAWSTEYKLFYIHLICMDYQNTQQTSPDFFFFWACFFSLDLRGQHLSQRLDSLKHVKPSEEFANQCCFLYWKSILSLGCDQKQQKHICLHIGHKSANFNF